MWVQTQLFLVTAGGSSTKGAGPSVHKGSAGKVLRPPSECAVVTEPGQGITGLLPGLLPDRGTCSHSQESGPMRDPGEKRKGAARLPPSPGCPHLPSTAKQACLRFWVKLGKWARTHPLPRPSPTPPPPCSPPASSLSLTSLQCNCLIKQLPPVEEPWESQILSKATPSAREAHEPQGAPTSGESPCPCPTVPSQPGSALGDRPPNFPVMAPAQAPPLIWFPQQVSYLAPFRLPLPHPQ